MVVCCGADDGTGLAGLGEVDVWVGGGEGGVSCADDGAVGLGGGHFACDFLGLFLNRV